MILHALHIRRGLLLRGLRTLVCLSCALVLMQGCAGLKASKKKTIVLDGIVPPSRQRAEAQELARQAKLAEEDGRFEDAIVAYRDAVAVYGDYAAAWNNLGAILLAQERYLEAAEVFIVAGERAPSDPRPMFNLGLTWERASYLDEALTHYSRALQRNPRYLPALRGAVHAQQVLGKLDEVAAERIRIALLIEHDPEWRAYFQEQRLRIRQEDRKLLGLDEG